MADYMADYMADLGKVYGTNGSTLVQKKTKHGTNEDTSKLDMQDYLNLMVASLKYQDMENSASVTDMMNQMVQISVIQVISELSTLISDSSVMTYAASLVGKNVTVGQYEGKNLTEIYGEVTGTGTLNGKQVIFLDNGESYYLTDIMAVGKLPPKDEIDPDGGAENQEEGSGDNSAAGSGGTGENTNQTQQV